MSAGTPIRAALLDSLKELHLPAIRACFEERRDRRSRRR